MEGHAMTQLARFFLPPPVVVSSSRSGGAGQQIPRGRRRDLDPPEKEVRGYSLASPKYAYSFPDFNPPSPPRLRTSFKNLVGLGLNVAPWLVLFTWWVAGSQP